MIAETMKLIVNADDYGYCPERNKGILDLFKSGSITSSTILITMEGIEESVSQAKKDGIKLGIHLNITEGKPCCDPKTISSITNENGYS